MAFWSFIQCRWCGFTGCGAPIGDDCPRCGRVLESEPAPKKPSAEEQVRAEHRAV